MANPTRRIYITQTEFKALCEAAALISAHEDDDLPGARETEKALDNLVAKYHKAER